MKEDLLVQFQLLAENLCLEQLAHEITLCCGVQSPNGRLLSFLNVSGINMYKGRTLFSQVVNIHIYLIDGGLI